MTPEQFLRSLHADTYESKPPDWEIDWADAPLTYKLYRRLPVIPLCPEVPLTLRRDGPPPSGPDLETVGYMLWHAYGVARLSQYPLDRSANPSIGPLQMYRRFVPSGGGLYPNELYIYLKATEAPNGVYHYDAAHHRLVLLREGVFDSFLSRALGNRCDISGCFGAVFVSVMFWKNFYKYHNFAYRLQGLDTGVLIGHLLESANRFGFESGVYYQFLDRAVNHLLGVSDQEESVYAVLPLSTKPTAAWFRQAADGKEADSAIQLCRELPMVRHEHYVRSQNIKEYPMLIRMNEASMQDAAGSFRQADRATHADAGIQAAYMPFVNRLSCDLATFCRSRYSPESDFVLRRVSQLELAALLQETTASFSSIYSDLNRPGEHPASRLSLYCSVYNVEGVPDGAYRYDGTAHMLRRVLPGDHRLRLQKGMSLDNVNLFQVPLCFHVVGDREYNQPELGYRGYRIQQMEAGMLVQRLLFAASAVGMGGRPLLGYDPAVCDELYNLADQKKTTLIQIPIGHYRGRPRLEGSLHT